MSNPLPLILGLGLPAILLTLALGHGIDVWKIHRPSTHGFARHWKSAVLIIAWFVFLVLDIPFLINQIADTTSPYWKFILLTLSGNWSPDAFPQSPVATQPNIGQNTPVLTPLARYGFSLAASVAFWLNNAVILGILGLVWKLAIERGKIMKFTAAFKLRELLAESAAAELAKEEFPDEESREKVMKVFRKAQAKSMEEVKQNLPAKDREVLLPILNQSTIQSGPNLS